MSKLNKMRKSVSKSIGKIIHKLAGIEQESNLVTMRSQEDSLENSNICIGGVSGSGTTVLMKEMALSTLAVGGKVFVVDYGKGFAQFGEFLGGVNIDFDLNAPISINPFPKVPMGDGRASIEAREDFLTLFLKVLATMVSPKCAISDSQQYCLTNALTECWDKKNISTAIDDIADSLEDIAGYLYGDIESDIANDLSLKLFDYTSKGKYGGFFKGKSEINFNTNIITVNAFSTNKSHEESLSENGAVMQVLTQVMLLINHMNAASGDKLQKRRVIIKQPRDSFNNLHSWRMLDRYMRVSRLYHMSYIIDSFSFTDFDDLDEGGSKARVFEGAATKIMMEHWVENLKQMSNSPMLEVYVNSDSRMMRAKSLKERGDFML